MIRPDKQRNALAALNAVLVVARSCAYAGNSVELADVLDVAEYLPMLMLEQPDRTDAFRGQLVCLVARRPEFALAVERFDATA